MTLKSEDAALFYELFLPLLNYVNHHYYVTEDIDFTGKRVDAAKAMEVARFLWEQPSIIDDYINENIFPLEEMDILSNWKHCIPGRFIIERHLKKGSIFISTKVPFLFRQKAKVFTLSTVLLTAGKICYLAFQRRSLSMLYCSTSKTALLPMGWYQ